MTGSAFALTPGERVDNFRLLDQNGASHELYYLSDAKAVVLMTTATAVHRPQHLAGTEGAARALRRAQASSSC